LRVHRSGNGEKPQKIQGLRLGREVLIRHGKAGPKGRAAIKDDRNPARGNR
jgi:hypothetical protein